MAREWHACATLVELKELFVGMKRLPQKSSQRRDYGEFGWGRKMLSARVRGIGEKIYHSHMN